MNKITALALCIYGDISNYIWTLFCFNFFLFPVFILFFHQRSRLIELGLQIENVDRVVIQFIFVSNGVRRFLFFCTVILLRPLKGCRLLTDHDDWVLLYWMVLLTTFEVLKGLFECVDGKQYVLMIIIMTQTLCFLLKLLYH